MTGEPLPLDLTNAAITEPITQPGVYQLDEQVYHADPVKGGSLSCTWARKLMPPSCPAKFAYERQHPKPPTADMEFGKIAHAQVLGVGAKVQVIDAADRRKKATQQEEKELRAEGIIPMLAGEYAIVEAMVKALRADKYAAALLNPDHGRPEQSLFWIDEQSGIWRRARFDWLRDRAPAGRRTLFCDYKTAKSAHPDDIEKAILNYGYHNSAAWYLDGARALDLAEPDAEFLLIVQEKSAPYVVQVARIAYSSLRIGREQNRRAIETYVECEKTGIWPGYVEGPADVALPPWAENRLAEELGLWTK
jgi:PDDEXK-like domain of unknown function (DUF3799)